MKKVLIIPALISLGIVLHSPTLCAEATVGVASSSIALDDGTPLEKRVVTKGFWSNWSISASIGTQFYLGENEKYMAFKDIWSFPAFDIYLNKWATPSFGWGLALSGSRFKGLCLSADQNNYAAYRTGNLYTTVNGREYFIQKGFWLNPHLYFTLDIASLINGYDQTRFWEPQIYAGGGIAIGFDSQFNRTAPTFNAGFINTFRLTDKIAIYLNVRGTLVGDDFDGESRGQESVNVESKRKNIPLDGAFGATVGLRIKLGQRRHQNFVPVSTYENVIVEQKSEIARLSNENISTVEREKELQKELAKTQNELVSTQTERDGLTAQLIQKDLDFKYHINFELNKTNLTNREILDLQLISEVMKQDTSRVYHLIGYADRQTGSEKRNMWLSEHRVNNVYDCLIETYGVNPSQLVKSFDGGVDTMFLEDNTLSRCVLIYSTGKKN